MSLIAACGIAHGRQCSIKPPNHNLKNAFIRRNQNLSSKWECCATSQVALKPGHDAQWEGGHCITVKTSCTLIFSAFPLASETLYMPFTVQRKLINISSERAFCEDKRCFSFQAGDPSTPARKNLFVQRHTPREQSLLSNFP